MAYYVKYNAICCRGIMKEKKDSNKRMAQGFIIGGLVLYVLVGAAAVGVYYYDTSGIKDRTAAAERVRDAASRLPEREQSTGDTAETVRETTAVTEEYDTEDGTAGAARDLLD